MKVVVIGAGLGGLSFGACAARDGHEVVLIDKNKEPGGVLALAKQDGFSFEQGPLILTDLLPEESLGGFLESLGIHLETGSRTGMTAPSPIFSRRMSIRAWSGGNSG